MNDPDLSEAQQALVDAEESLLAAACPGAGKTQAMVARYLKRTGEEDRRGVALLSFTNTAVDEVRLRCAQRADALRVPHFVGTFDAFVHRFVVTAFYAKAFGQKPNYVQSWADIDSARFRLPEMGRTRDLDLAWFDFEPDGRAQLILGRVPHAFGDAAAHRMLARRKPEAESQAAHLFGRLLRAGTVSCEAARVLAEYRLSIPDERAVLAPLLRARFAEIIVDEAQDCGREELLILRFLRDCGVRIVMVGDLDQAIYEFRNATPAAVEEFAAGLPGRISLGDNWRSSRAVCAFNSALRSGRLTEAAYGDASLTQHPVHLLQFTKLEQIVPAALEVAERYKLSAKEMMLLSHAEAHGMKAAGAVNIDSSASSRVLAIAHAGFQLRSQQTAPKTRRGALAQVERAVLAALTADRATPDHSLAALCEEAGLERRWLEGFAVRMALALDPTGQSKQVFAAEVRAFLKTASWGVVPPPDPAVLSRLFKAPLDSAWAGVAGFGITPAVRHSTVHGVKGMEFPGVVLVLPERLRVHPVTERTVLDDWEGDHDSEARRVLYVAGSRARRLLICAVHRKHAARVSALLTAWCVPHLHA
ncbi:UvrD-helicase domain-containing protein [Streptomyces natalensis]|uniref:DNA 3'-5' helicase n=1 Tax=Streptomyces natalensis ATCC 27448 TaxID=1240678 RepID=A0A0D7CGF6_9ACTN|nr:UvrD-helicase domain-containing protein [Streptomyces natalensis]KIZ14950.1 hypothetical protein SNA_29945 [Streptomyces natalensis ATCC 27448]